LQQATDRYQKKYGITPEFKAGIHFGPVIAGEIGVVKRDIVYSGDVLNTTARIQAKCNENEVDLLLSKELFDQLPLPPHHFSPRKIGHISLRGKQDKMVLYTVEIKVW
jgi:adenylate cyclase